MGIQYIVYRRGVSKIAINFRLEYRKTFLFLISCVKCRVLKLIVMRYEEVYSLPAADALCFVFVCDIHVNIICNQRVIDVQ
jgi:hypothetical protein